MFTRFAGIFHNCTWKERYKNIGGDLDKLVNSLPDVLLKSRAPNTVNKYKYGYEKFCKWCKQFNINSLPANDFDVALYFVSLLQNGCSYSIIEDAFYSIHWVHEISNNLNPCKSSLVVNAKEGALRSVGRTVTKKEPITPEILDNLVKMYGSETTNIFELRTMCLFLLGYAGFFRFSELVNIKREDISFYEHYMCIRITKSKTDQYREGAEAVIAKTGLTTCPVTMLQRYISLACVDNSNGFIFRSLTLIKSTGIYKFKGLKSLTYTRAREILLDVIGKLGLDKSKFGLHSLRSGGATAAANAGVSDRLFKKHGRWKTDTAKDGYVKEDINERISVSKHLGI